MLHRSPRTPSGPATPRPASAIALAFAALAAISLPCTAAGAQNDFVNFETGQVHPIDTCTVSAGGNSRPLMLICNTPADQLEIRDAVAPYGLIAAIPTGMRPVTVRWEPVMKRAYVCNFLGDSVSVVQITGSAGGGGTVVVEPRLLFTNAVGDEPADISFPSSRVAFVALRSPAKIVTCATANMVPLTATGDQRFAFELVPDDGTPSHWVVPKHPWMMELRGPRMFLLDRMDDNRADFVSTNRSPQPGPGRVFVEGIDLVAATLDTSQPYTDWILNPTSKYRVNGIGTTMHSMALNDAGDLMFVVASDARHLTTTSEADVADEPFGFVESWLKVVDVTAGSAPVVHGEHTVGAAPIPSINLNKDYTAPTPKVVAATVAQPTGLTVIDGGAQPTLCITGFNSDRVVFMTFNTATQGGWDITPVTLAPRSGYGIAGPRAAHYDAATGKVFVSRSLDNSFSVLDAANPGGGATTVALEFDPRPQVVLAGHEFLYSSAHSKTNTVSCASCHIDGTTDGLEWNLSDMSNDGIDDPLRDRIRVTNSTVVTFPPQKGRIITQTLQGLLNFPVEGDDAADLVSNRPYHWRGDREGFESFQPAFVNLLGGKGIDKIQMSAFRRLVDTIMHPPNPNQAVTRTVTGDDLVGMEVFCTERTLLSQASCVHCHSFPDGSNNRLTEVFGAGHPLETAAVRNIFAREGVLTTVNHVPTPTDALTWFRLTAITHDSPLSSQGVVSDHNINHFLMRFFNGANGNPQSAARRSSLSGFVRQWDTGVAPIVGYAYTLQGSAVDDGFYDLMKGQVGEANAGLVAFARTGTTYTSYWYDLTFSGGARFREGNTTNGIDFAALKAIANVADSTVVLQSVPVGSANMLATKGVPYVVAQSPFQVTLRAMAPPTHMTEVAQFTTNWATSSTMVPFIPSVAALRMLQSNVLTASGAANDVGMNALKVEPTRRFRVTGYRIYPGAKLIVSGPYLPADLELPLFPTTHMIGDRPIWETAVELDDLLTLAMLNGGPSEPWVAHVLAFKTGVSPTPPPIGAAFDISIRNRVGPASPPVAQVLTIQDGR